ncbi:MULTISPECIES: hypothetical protein [Moorena]|uniref:Uncharacterized protein n=1 Tax=Moorena producens (strain JHB) TaxID=1454205 RepID=A0A1D9G1J3_MOOP1|nr:MULTISPECIES: hypothetical protein [Moorena]AOY81489.2 hypothetical protein BJP36_17790 [Moorena producens JHB]NEP67678.1 hypothetical protein [Moorena sp. SIO3A5]
MSTPVLSAIPEFLQIVLSFPYSSKLKRFNLKKFNLKTFPTKNAKAEQPPTLQPSNPPTLQPSNPPTLQPPTLQPPTFNLQPSTFNPPTLQPSNPPNLQPPTSNLQPSKPSTPKESTLNCSRC